MKDRDHWATVDRDRIDLGALDARIDPVRFQARVRATLVAAAPELARRRRAPTIWEVLAAWRRPLLGLATGMTLASGVALIVRPQSAPPPAATAAPTFEQAFIGWSRRGILPSAEEVVRAAQVRR